MLNSLGPTWGPVDHSNRKSIRTGRIRKDIMRGFELKLDKWIKVEYDKEEQILSPNHKDWESKVLPLAWESREQLSSHYIGIGAFIWRMFAVPGIIWKPQRLGLESKQGNPATWKLSYKWGWTAIVMNFSQHAAFHPATRMRILRRRHW